MVQNICRNSFSRDKSRKNGISVIKITFYLQKIPQNYRFPCVNTKTIKYTCRFNTSQLWCLIFDIFHFVISYINGTRKKNSNNCIKNKKKEALICIKVKCFQKFPMIIKLFEVDEQISVDKWIKLCFHVQRFSMNCFCVSFNSLSKNV